VTRLGFLVEGIRVGSGSVDGTNTGCVGCCVVEGKVEGCELEVEGKGETNPVRGMGSIECGLVNFLVFTYVAVAVGTKYPLLSVEV